MAVEQQTSYNSYLFIRQPERSKAGQRLTIPNRKVTKLGFWLKKSLNPTGNITFAIRRVSDDSVIVSKVLGDASILTTSPVYYEVTFDSPVTINEEVRILCEWPYSQTDNYPQIAYQNSNVKADEYTSYSTDGGWTNQTGWDTAYKYTYTGVPALTIQFMTDILQRSATGNGTITDLGNALVTQHGHCWSTSPNPTISDAKTELGATGATGAFPSNLTGLLPRTTYYVRAYAKNASGTGYSSEISFTTAIEALSPNAAGDRCTFLFEAGDSCPDHYKNVDDPKDYPDDDTTWVGAEVAPGNEPLYDNSYELYNLENHSIGLGTIYQIEVFFRCKAQNTPTRSSAKAVIKTGGTVYAGTSKTVTTSWADYSQVWATNPDTGLPWTWPEIDALQAGVALRRCQPSGVGYRTYCTQVYVEVEYEGSEAPTVTTDPATSIGQTTVVPNGTLDDDGGDDCDCGFEYGETTDYGNTTATDAKITGETFSQEVRGLKGGTVYHFRAVATNSAGTSYGVDRTFHTEALSAEAHQALGKHHAMGRKEV